MSFKIIFIRDMEKKGVKISFTKQNQNMDITI